MSEKEEFSLLKDGHEYKYYSGGEWKISKSGKTIPIKNPYKPEIPNGFYPHTCGVYQRWWHGSNYEIIGIDED